MWIPVIRVVATPEIIIGLVTLGVLIAVAIGVHAIDRRGERQS